MKKLWTFCNVTIDFERSLTTFSQKTSRSSSSTFDGAKGCHWESFREAQSQSAIPLVQGLRKTLQSVKNKRDQQLGEACHTYSPNPRNVPGEHRYAFQTTNQPARYHFRFDRSEYNHYGKRGTSFNRTSYCLCEGRRYVCYSPIAHHSPAVLSVGKLCVKKTETPTHGKRVNRQC